MFLLLSSPIYSFIGIDEKGFAWIWEKVLLKRKVFYLT